MLNAELKILGGKYQGKFIPLSSKRFLVGREQDCQLRPNSELVSRHHCVFLVDDYAVRLRDLGSTNGTRLNGDLVRGEVVLRPGDKVSIGKLEVELVVHSKGAVSKTPPTEASTSAPQLESLLNTATLEMPALSGDLPGLDDIPVLNPLPGDDSNFEIPSTPPIAPVLPAGFSSAPTVANSTGDTTIIPGGAGMPMAPFVGYPQPQPMGYPMGYGYGMPGQMPGYPQPMPGYMPAGYPMQPGYPMGVPVMAGMPPQYAPTTAPAATPAAAGAPGGAGAVSEMPVQLPDPVSTGLKSSAPPPAPAGGPSAAPAKTENPSQSAADIIKQYMQKRTK